MLYSTFVSYANKTASLRIKIWLKMVMMIEEKQKLTDAKYLMGNFGKSLNP